MWWVDVVYFTNSLYVFFHSGHSAKAKKGASLERLEKGLWVQVWLEVMCI